MQRLLSVEEAAEFLNISVSEVYKLKHFGTIPYVKLGRRLLFDQEKLEEWVLEHARPVETGE